MANKALHTVKSQHPSSSSAVVNDRRMAGGGGGSSSSSSSSFLLFRSNSIYVNSLVLFLALGFISFNTWITLHYVVFRDDSSSSGGGGGRGGGGSSASWQYDASHAPPMITMHQHQHSSASATSASSPYGFFVPEGGTPALPSIRTTADEEKSIVRDNLYGGAGDKPHLGGFTNFDNMGISPSVWTHMIRHLGIRSVLDVGCGRGVSTSWFILHGLEYVACAEGSHDAIVQSIVPHIEKEGKVPNGTEYELVEHDFSRGPWWPSRTVDAVWCVEFTEHVGRNFQPNYLASWCKAALIFMTHSKWGGWHHVEVHSSEWWIVRMEAMGFRYSDILTKEIRKKVDDDHLREDLTDKMKKGIGQHIWGSMLVFINPLVSSLEEHAHLFAEHGCHSNGVGGQECGKGSASKLTPLPDGFKPLSLTKQMDDEWMTLMKDHVLQS